MIVAMDSEKKLVLVRQYRAPIDAMTLEFPVGGVKVTQTPEEAARAELAEEAQCGSEIWKGLGALYLSAARSDQKFYVFFACDVYPVVGEPDENEEFEITRVTVEEFEALVAQGEICSGPTLAAWSLARPRVMALIAE